MRLFLFLLLCAGSMAACKNQPKEADSSAVEVQLPADFFEFYDKFHSDSAYQVAHITWPLQGDTDEKIDSVHFQKKRTAWTPENWRMQRMDFNHDDYFFDRQMLGDLIIVERIRPRTANYGIERRFAKQSDGQWALIYYSDLQEIK
jgi:hypothetical protein